MPPFQICFTKKGEQDLEAISEPHYSRIFSSIGELSRNPRPEGFKKLQGFNSLFRIRVGDYRIAYEIRTKAGVVVITCVGHRGKIYNLLKRRYGL